MLNYSKKSLKQQLKDAYASRDAWQARINELERKINGEKHFDKTIDQQREEQYWAEKRRG